MLPKVLHWRNPTQAFYSDNFSEGRSCVVFMRNAASCSADGGQDPPINVEIARWHVCGDEHIEYDISSVSCLLLSSPHRVAMLLDRVCARRLKWKKVVRTQRIRKGIRITAGAMRACSFFEFQRSVCSRFSSPSNIFRCCHRIGLMKDFLSFFWISCVCCVVRSISERQIYPTGIAVCSRPLLIPCSVFIFIIFPLFPFGIYYFHIIIFIIIIIMIIIIAFHKNQIKWSGSRRESAVKMTEHTAQPVLIEWDRTRLLLNNELYCFHFCFDSPPSTKLLRFSRCLIL